LSSVKVNYTNGTSSPIFKNDDVPIVEAKTWHFNPKKPVKEIYGTFNWDTGSYILYDF